MTAEEKALPEGWAWTALGDVTEIQGGLAKGKRRKATSTRPVPYLRVANVQRGHLKLDDVQEIEATASEIEALRLQPGDVLFNEGGDRDKLGRGWIWEGQISECIHQNHVFRARPDSLVVEPKYVSHYGNSEGRIYFFGSGTQSVNLASISKSKLSALPLPLPPLAEQRRIVAKIEALTARSRRAREALEALPALLDRYRASVLAAAFRGDLTKDWRAENPDLTALTSDVPEIDGPFALPQGWRWARFDAVAQVASNLVQPSDYPDSPHIAPNHIEGKTGRLLEYSTVSADGVTSAKHHFVPGQIIYSKIRPYLAKAVVVDFEGLCSADAYPINTELQADYLQKWLISEPFTALAAQSQGRTVLPKINKAALGKLPVPVCSDPEMRLIAEKVRAAFKMIERLAEIMEGATDRLSILDQSILAKAFRGELVPQDPTDEPASALLDHIRARRAAEGTAAKRGRRKTA